MQYRVLQRLTKVVHNKLAIYSSMIITLKSYILGKDYDGARGYRTERLNAMLRGEIFFYDSIVIRVRDFFTLFRDCVCICELGYITVAKFHKRYLRLEDTQMVKLFIPIRDF